MPMLAMAKISSLKVRLVNRRMIESAAPRVRELCIDLTNNNFFIVFWTFAKMTSKQWPLPTGPRLAVQTQGRSQ